MAKEIFEEQSSLEELIYPVDFTNSLLTGVTVSSVTIVHTPPPHGASATIGNTVTTPIAYIKVPSGLSLGNHIVDVTATTSNADLSPGIRLHIKVDF